MIYCTYMVWFMKGDNVGWAAVCVVLDHITTLFFKLIKELKKKKQMNILGITKTSACNNDL